MTEDAEYPDGSHLANDLLKLARRLAGARKLMNEHIAKVRRGEFQSSNDFYDEQIALGTALGSAERDLSEFIDKIPIE